MHKNMETAKIIAETKGGKLLDTVYVNDRHKYLFECRNGHQFTKRLDTIRPTQNKSGSWCTICAYSDKRFKIEDIKYIAEQKGGICLTEKADKSSHETPVTIKCKYDHIWTVRASNIIAGSWCKKCLHNGERKIMSRKIKIEKPETNDIEQEIREKINSQPKIMISNKITKEKEELFEKFKKMIENKKGILLNKHLNKNLCLNIKCQNNHFFTLSQDDMAKNWCQECNNKIQHKKITKDDNYEKIEHIVSENKGSILTDIYYGLDIELPFCCENEHVWLEKPKNIMKNKWCQQCKGFFSERLCNIILEYLFDKKFVKYRPDWLINKDGNKMELDMHNEELKLALEYNGIQHYRYIDYYHKTKENFNKRKESDKIKVESCEKNKINLIVVPYTVTTNKLYEYIRNECIKYGYQNIKTEPIDYNNFDELKNWKISKLNKIKNHAVNLGGLCLSDRYFDSYTPMIFKCKNNHSFKITSRKLTQGVWCKLCKFSEQQLSIIAEQIKKYNGTCSEKIYKHCRQKLNFTCEKGHLFFMTRESLTLGRWCNLCNK